MAGVTVQSDINYKAKLQSKVTQIRPSDDI